MNNTVYMAIRAQQTISQPVSCTGIGLHSGADVNMVIKPAPADTGIIFVRTDVKGFNPRIGGTYRNVTSTTLGTTLSNEDGTIVSTVEHLMAAFWGCEVDNAYVELDGPEIPIMDGSSEPFVFLIECAGIMEQPKLQRIVEVTKRVEIIEEDKHVIVEPANQFEVSLEIDFDSDAIANQQSRFTASSLSFKKDISRARTFGFEHEINYMHSQGLAKGGSLANAVVVSGDKVLNKEGLRYKDEFVRHKILDCIGDFNLTGGIHVKGHFSGYRSGHTLNNKLLRAFFADASAWNWMQQPAAIKV